jgi:predicted nuclease with RNAse H fold
MRTIQQFLGTSALALIGLGAQASEFTPLLSVTQATWPGKNHIGVVCNYADSKEQIQSLCDAAGSDATVTVVDARHERHLSSARNILLQRKADYLVLMPKGGVFREGGFQATRLVRTLASSGIPSIGTTPKALQQGAVFAVGEQTGWTLLVNDNLVGTISVVLPQKGQVFKGGGAGQATLTLVGMD